MKKKVKQSRNIRPLAILNPNVAGIDVGASCHYVCVGALAEESVRRFTTFTQDLEDLADWLVSVGVKSVAMESTGIYWVNLYDVLESRGLEVCLANARYVRNVPGRKSDVADSQWIQQLHSYGLLTGSFIAEGKTRELRAYVRQRENLEKQKAIQVALMGKSLQLLNIKIHQIASGTELQTSMNVIRAIVLGERNPKVLAAFRHPQMKASPEEFEKGVQGNWRAEHLFSLKQALTMYDFVKGQMIECEREIEKTLGEINGGLGDESRPKSKRVIQNDYSFDVKSYIHEIAGVDLTQIRGLDEKTILTILSETGTNYSKWQSAEQFTSWLGLAPKPKITGEKIVGHFKHSVANRANQAFRMAAWALNSSKCYLGSFYRKLSSRKGSFVAIKATARKVAVIFWNMMTKKTEFETHSQEEYETKYKDRQLKNLERMAKKLGMTLQRADS
jgi:transposase